MGFLSALVLVMATLLHLVGPHTSTGGGGEHGDGDGGALHDAVIVAPDVPAALGEAGLLVADDGAPRSGDHGAGAEYECWGRSEGTAELRAPGLVADTPTAPAAVAHPRAAACLSAPRPPPTPPVPAPDLVRELGISRT